MIRKDSAFFNRLNNIKTDELTNYGLQLYWMTQSRFDMCGTLTRSFERADYKHDVEDAMVRRIVHFLHVEGIRCGETLFEIMDDPVRSSEVLK